MSVPLTYLLMFTYYNELPHSVTQLQASQIRPLWATSFQGLHHWLASSL